MEINTDIYNYSYDSLGNIIRINNDSYSYDNHNYLIKATINNKSYTYSYDEAGNIINYNGKILKYNNKNELISIDGKIVTTTNGHISTYEGNKLIWQGNHLIKYNDNTYSYDSNGLRRSRNNIKYYYENNNLVKEIGGNELSYLYVNSAPYGNILEYNGQIAKINNITGLNLYAYCNNNPIMYDDPEGNFAISLIVGLVVSFAIGTTASAISQYVQYGDVNWLIQVLV